METRIDLIALPEVKLSATNHSNFCSVAVEFGGYELRIYAKDASSGMALLDAFQCACSGKVERKEMVNA